MKKMTLMKAWIQPDETSSKAESVDANNKVHKMTAL